MNYARVSLLAMSLLFVFGIAACGGTQENIIAYDEGGPPSWYSDRSGEKPGVVYGYGSSNNKTEQLARTSAAATAQRELANFVSVKVQALFEQYLKEAGVSGETVASQQTEDALRVLTNQRITGFRVDKEGWDKARKNYYARGYLDFDSLSKLGEAFRTSADLNNALDKVQQDRDAFFNRLDDALKNGFDK